MQYLTGVTFPQQTFTPAEWGQMFSVFPDGILTGCAVTASGTDVYIAEGAMIIKGRLIAIPATVTESTSPTYSNGYGRVTVNIDTTNASTTLLNQQAYVDTDYSSTSTFGALTTDDINDAGTLYQVELAILKYTSGSISDVSQSLGNAFGASKLVGSDANGQLTAVNVDMSYLENISSDVQTQLDAKQPTITYGTTDPTGGSDGDVYIKYSA